MKLPEFGFSNPLFRDADAGFLNATGGGYVTDEPYNQSTTWTDPFREAYLKSFNLYTPADSSLVQSGTQLTSLSTDVKKDYSWLNQVLGIVNSGVTGYFNSEATKASQTLTADEIAKAIQGYQQQLAAEEEAKRRSQTITLVVAAVLGVALLVGAYFLLRKK